MSSWCTGSPTVRREPLWGARGAVRAGNLYYLRELQGKNDSIKEDRGARTAG